MSTFFPRRDDTVTKKTFSNFIYMLGEKIINQIFMLCNISFITLHTRSTHNKNIQYLLVEYKYFHLISPQGIHVHFSLLCKVKCIFKLIRQIHEVHESKINNPRGEQRETTELHFQRRHFLKILNFSEQMVANQRTMLKTRQEIKRDDPSSKFIALFFKHVYSIKRVTLWISPDLRILKIRKKLKGIFPCYTHTPL